MRAAASQSPWVDRHPFHLGQVVADGTHRLTVTLRGEDALGLWFAAAEMPGRFPVAAFWPLDPPPHTPDPKPVSMPAGVVSSPLACGPASAALAAPTAEAGHPFDEVA